MNVSNDNNGGGDVNIHISTPQTSLTIINNANSNKKRSIFVALSYAPKRLRNCFPRKIDWNSWKEWIRQPINKVSANWNSYVTISGAIQILFTTGMLNRVFPEKSQRDIWIEVNNQVFNALFTITCLCKHPEITRHTVLLSRWRPNDDIPKLRKVYCKGGTGKPHERSHMLVILVLMHTSLLAQYFMCGLYLWYNMSNRPSFEVQVGIGVMIVTSTIVGAYATFSPLNRDYSNSSGGSSNNSSGFRRDLERAEYFYWVAKNQAKSGKIPCRKLVHF